MALSERLSWLVRHPVFRADPVGTSLRVARWEYRRFRGRPVVLPLADLRFEARPSDGIARLLSYFGDQADELFAFMRRFLRPGDVLVDVGANIGTHAVLGATLVGKGGRVQAIEADPQTYEFLTRNVARNRLKNVVTHNICASDAAGSVTFNINRNSARNSMVSAGESTIRLPADRLDAILAGIGPIALLKIDVEGADLMALRGASAFFRETPPLAVVIETNRDSTDIQDWLTERGYILFDFDAGTHRLKPMGPDILNVYALRPDAVARME